jgi:predicted DCC family thiol-disulfide oxidoreductase YuxK
MRFPEFHGQPSFDYFYGMETADASLVLFDGLCNLCSGTVRFILKRDRRLRFRYAPLDGPTASRILSSPGADDGGGESFILYENGRIWRKSTAALRVARKLDGAWPLLYAFIFVPPFMRDAVYDLVAANRYRWFGKKDSCWMPRPEWARLFPDLSGDGKGTG